MFKLFLTKHESKILLEYHTRNRRRLLEIAAHAIAELKETNERIQELSTIAMESLISKCSCGSEAKLISEIDPGERVKEFVECTNPECAMSGPVSKTQVFVDHEMAKAEAIASWNAMPRVNVLNILSSARNLLNKIERNHTPDLDEEYYELDSALQEYTKRNMQA